jgi:hypothetical protein
VVAWISYLKIQIEFSMPWIGPAKDGEMQALAQLVAHIPHKGEQMVRYYGYWQHNGFYSNKSRGRAEINSSRWDSRLAG